MTPLEEHQKYLQQLYAKVYTLTGNTEDTVRFIQHYSFLSTERLQELLNENLTLRILIYLDTFDKEYNL